MSNSWSNHEIGITCKKQNSIKQWGSTLKQTKWYKTKLKKKINLKNIKKPELTRVISTNQWPKILDRYDPTGKKN